MVGKRLAGALRLAALGAAVTLALGSCQVLFIGAFPAAIGQATARADLSALIASGPAGTFNLKRVGAGSQEFFVLFSAVGFDATQAHILVLDDSLKVVNRYASIDLGGPPSSPNAMMDANGDVVIGDTIFNLSPGGLTPTGSTPVSIGPSASGKPTYANNEVGFNLAGGNLNWTEYNSAWGAPTPEPPSTISLGPTNLFLSEVLTEQDSSSMPDIFVLRGNGSDTYFLIMPKQFMDSSQVGSLIAFLGGASVFSVFDPLGYLVRKSGLEDTIGLAYGNIYAYDHDSNSLVHFTLDKPNREDLLSMPWVSGMKIAAGATGNFCVVWDPDTRTLTKYDQWW